MSPSWKERAAALDEQSIKKERGEVSFPERGRGREERGERFTGYAVRCLMISSRGGDRLSTRRSYLQSAREIECREGTRVLTTT